MDGASAETVVCVLGAPRSGTSLTARMLNLCGLYLGETDDLLPPGPENQAGFWEWRRAVDLNERVLRAVGGSRIAAPALPRGWEESPSLAELRDEGAALIAETFAGRRAWGWKDPRNSFTLPFWRALLARPVSSVICVRNPLDSAASGRRMAGPRHEMSEQQAIEAWERYTAGAIVNSNDGARLFVSYEEILRDPHTEAERLARFARLEPPPGEVDEELAALVDRKLQHHRTPPEAALSDRRLPASATSLYRALWPLLRGEPATSAADEEVERLSRNLLARDPERIVGPPALRP
ncbi:MAG TPA: sulfotransferase [Solirubrobacterales bacterium]|nr:sulfotransferase [Solirubrobacterales bacterium]